MKNYNTPIVRGLLNLKEKDAIRFHMPGHKGRSYEAIKPLIDNLLQLDFTEIDGSDDLYNPNGIIKESLSLLGNERGSKRSFYLTSGTTVGILAGIMGLTSQGDKILITKNCHKSVYNAIELNRLVPIILEHEPLDSGLEIPISQEIFISKLKEQKDIKMVVLSRPNYFGLSKNIKDLIEYCKENHIYLFIDEAHGSHLRYHEDLTDDAMTLGASLSVNSFHKTLPSLTQSSVINFNQQMSDIDISKVLSMIEKLQSSSPSYLLMASLEISSAFMKECGNKKLKELKSHVDEFNNSVQKLDFLKVITSNHLMEHDFTRIVLETDFPALYLKNHLENNGIFVEMITRNILVLIATVMDEKSDFITLSKSIKSFNLKKYLDVSKYKRFPDTYDISKISFNHAEGKTLKENIIIYPPGTIYLKKGDVITKKDIDYLTSLIEDGIHVFTDFNKNLNNLYVE
ncbi:MAG: aminotransferase class I/II-fold pyridoxal phosphate-dependent enzyme [Lagierella massiliensis]|nr:aminotransferase class I/II-fold pyridoxal phosphate-dependent enzyme [Lagierella massiliensis]